MPMKILVAVITATLISQKVSAIQSTFYASEMRNGVFVIDTDQRYDRYADSYFGATVRLLNPIFDDDGNYLVTPGESWEWVWERVDPPQHIATVTLSYIGGDGRCWSDGSCGAYSEMTYGIYAPCLSEGDYKVTILHNGASMGSYAWRPTRFKPAVYYAWMPELIKPRAYAYVDNAQSADYYLVVTDDLGCNQPLDGVEVTVKAQVVNDEAAHGHMRSESGTGTFISAGFNSFVTEAPPQITGKTHDGLYRAAYKAGEHGVHEIITTSLNRPATSIDPAVSGTSASTGLKIEIPNLERITTEDGPVIFADANGCPHEPAPNWLTPSAKGRMVTVANWYFYATGRKLSLNDSSLQYGGIIDNKNSGGRNAQCHISHRRGNDIDINTADSGGVNMLTSPLIMGGLEVIKVDGEPWLLVDFLTHLASWVEGKRHKEETIHYRFPG